MITDFGVVAVQLPLVQRISNPSHNTTVASSLSFAILTGAEGVLPAPRQPWPNDHRPAIEKLMAREGFLARFFQHGKLAAPTGLFSFARTAGRSRADGHRRSTSPNPQRPIKSRFARREKYFSSGAPFDNPTASCYRPTWMNTCESRKPPSICPRWPRHFFPWIIGDRHAKGQRVGGVLLGADAKLLPASPRCPGEQRLPKMIGCSYTRGGGLTSVFRRFERSGRSAAKPRKQGVFPCLGGLWRSASLQLKVRCSTD